MARVLVLLLPLLQMAHSLEVQGISLEGGGGEYLEMGGTSRYVLRCDYRVAYDEEVTQVTWYKFGQPVYTWTINSNPSVLPPLLGHVDTAPETNGHNLHFTHMSYSLAGNYTCRVTADTTTVNSEPYPLSVIDANGGEFICSVQVLQVMMNNTNSTDERDKYEVEGGTEDVDFEPPECTLVWSISTPPIFPKPNITCGYFSFDHDDVTHRLPAGLTLHKFPNASWQAYFKESHIQVKDIPTHHRLGCTVRIPGTSFKKVIRDDDDFLVDNLIDSSGCPSLTSDESLRLRVHVDAATHTCRGDVLPEDRSGRATATVRCPPRHAAVFGDGRMEGSWEMTLTCAENDLGWRTVPDDPKNIGRLYNTQDLPHCQPGGVNGGVRWCYGGQWWVLLLLTTLHHL